MLQTENRTLALAQVVDLNALYRTDFEEVRRDNPELMIEMHKAIYRNQPSGANASEQGRPSHNVSSREDEAEARTSQATRLSDATEAGDTTVLVGSRSFASVMSQLAVKTEFSSRLIKAITDKVKLLTFHFNPFTCCGPAFAFGQPKPNALSRKFY